MYIWQAISREIAQANASIPVMDSVIAGYAEAEARETSALLTSVRAFLEAFQSSLLDRKAVNGLLITYLRAEAVVLTA